MADNETTQFEKVGDDGIISHVVNMSGQRSPYTIEVPRDKGSASGDIQGVGTKSNRSATLIHEANGPACHVQATISYPNAEGVNQTLRNVRLVKPSGGNNFYGARAEAGNTGNV